MTVTVTRTSVADDPLLVAIEFGEYLHLSAKTLANLRSAGDGPRYVKLGRRYFYRRSALNAYITAHEIDPEKRDWRPSDDTDIEQLTCTAERQLSASQWSKDQSSAG